MKLRLLILRLVFLTTGILLIVIPLIIDASPKSIELVDAECYLNGYYEGLDDSYCDIVLHFDKDIDRGNAIIAFYNDENKLLERKSISFYGRSDKTADTTVYIDGKVDTFEVEEFDCVISDIAPSVAWFSLIFFAIFLSLLLVSYKEYDYNGEQITVYAGYNKHYLCVNGQKCDEHNTFVFYTPLYLETTLENGEKLEVTISLTNRITTKINGKLIEAIKTPLIKKHS